jgi:hypothetical protein
MKITDKEIMVCLDQMPSDMKQRVIMNIESELGITLPEYKEKQIKAAEAFIADDKAKPEGYTTVIYNQKKDETVGNFDISPELEQEFERIRLFIGYRSTMIYRTDGTVEQHPDASYEDFLKAKALI